MTYERWRWYLPDQTWKDNQPAPASLDARQAKVEVTVSQLIGGLLDHFGEEMTVELQVEHEADTSPPFRLLGVDQREDGPVVRLRFADGDGVAEVPCSHIKAIRVLDY